MPPSAPLASPAAIRTVTCCKACGAEYDPADEPEETDACPAHGVELVKVRLDRSWRDPAAVATSTTLTTAQIDTVRAWLDSVTARGAELQPHERDLLAACDRTDAAARTWVAAAFNTLQRGA